MPRMSDVKRGRQLNEALTRYTSYLTTVRTPNVNSRGARAAQTVCGVIPFDIELGAGEIIQVNSPTEGVAALSTIINENPGSEVLTGNGLNGKTVAVFRGFKPARVVVVQATTRSVTVATSGITGSRYLKYQNTDRFSCAFGRQSDASTGKMVTVFQELKGRYRNRTGFEINRVSITPEKFSFRG
jgi:hypothetical protein